MKSLLQFDEKQRSLRKTNSSNEINELETKHQMEEMKKLLEEVSSKLYYKRNALFKSFSMIQSTDEAIHNYRNRRMQNSLPNWERRSFKKITNFKTL